MEKVYRLIDEITAAIMEVYPEMTMSSVTVAEDGYVDITVRRRSGERVRWLLDQSRIDGKWLDDRSEKQNAYMAELGELLVEG